MSIKLKNNQTTEDIRLDRVIQFDERSLKYSIADLRKSSNLRSYTWRCNDWFDQGREGACHIEGTEVLTEKGWKDFRDIDKDTKLATINQTTQELEYQKPSALQRLDYNGEMVESTNRNVLFSVTPDHRMWVRPWDEKTRSLSNKYEFIKAEEIKHYSGLMLAPSQLKHTKLIEDIQIGKGERGRLISGDDIAAFMGIFLAEGCLYHPANSGSYRIEIAAVKEDCRDEVYQIVSSLGFNVTIYNDRYTIHSKPLFDFLKPFYQTGALTKVIPEWIYTAPKRQVNLFLDAFCLGDGHNTKCGRKFYYTSSKDLADGIQILYLGIGVRSSVLTRDPKDSCINGRIIKKENCATSYVVSPWKKLSLSLNRSQQTIKSNYTGKVYCATVENSTLITRYKGTILISGNCVGFALGHELAARPAEVRGLDYNYLIQEIYWEAQKIDPWEGGAYPDANPRYDGTSVLAGVKRVQKLGWIEGYRWAFNIEDVLYGLGHNGPAVLGVAWYDSMYTPDENGFIKPTGNLVGGHAILARAVNVSEGYVTLRNSWGKDWGKDGDCYITFEDLEALLKQNGECCFLLKRKTRLQRAIAKILNFLKIKK